MSGNVNCNCLFCGRSFTKKKSDFEASKRHFCSRDCFENHARGKPTVTCRTCGVRKEVKNGRAKASFHTCTTCKSRGYIWNGENFSGEELAILAGVTSKSVISYRSKNGLDLVTGEPLCSDRQLGVLNVVANKKPPVRTGPFVARLRFGNGKQKRFKLNVKTALQAGQRTDRLIDLIRLLVESKRRSVEIEIIVRHLAEAPARDFGEMLKLVRRSINLPSDSS